MCVGNSDKLPSPSVWLLVRTHSKLIACLYDEEDNDDADDDDDYAGDQHRNAILL